MKLLKALLTIFMIIYLIQIFPLRSDPHILSFESIPIKFEDSDEIHMDPTEPEHIEIVPEDAQILMRIAAAEAKSEGVEGKALVMAVVLNRVKNEDFPDSIREVVFQKNQFSPIADGRYDTICVDQECCEALDSIVSGKYQEFTALYFDSCENSWASRNKEYIDTIGKHNFYK